jgi:PilZ domain
VDTKIINVYNEKNQKLVGSGLIIVDAATEPLRVLKVLVEGLPDGRSGLWLTNFKGIPVARTLSPFDLVYLEAGYVVVHCVEISVEGEYEPFRGDPASALVLPPRSITMSRTQPGDRLLFRTGDAPAAQPTSGPRPSRATPRPPLAPAPTNPSEGAHFFNSAFPVPPADGSSTSLPGFLGTQAAGGPLPGATASATLSAEQTPSAQAPNAAVSGRLTKSANSVLGTSTVFRPSSNDEPSPASREINLGGGPGSAMAVQSSPAPVEMAFSLRMPTRLMATPLELGAVADQAPEAQATAAVQSGRLLRTVNLAPAILPMEEPEPEPPVVEAAPTAVETTTASALEALEGAAPAEVIPEREKQREPGLEPAHGIVIPITSAPHYVAPAVPETPAAPMPIEPEPSAAPAARAALVPVEAPAPKKVASAVASPIAAEPKAMPPQGAAATAVPSAPVAQPAESGGVLLPPAASYPRTQIKPAEKENALAIPQKKKPSWDVRLLYKLFPEFDPARPPEIRFPRMDEKKPVIDEEEEMSPKLRMLCWLYPDLQLDKVKQKRSEERRAVRLPAPGLVAYFFTGGSPRPHPIKDISVTGFYMVTNERWLPGTIIRVTLQMVNARPDGGRDSVTVHSRVVRWGPDGGGFEFVLPGFLEQ